MRWRGLATACLAHFTHDGYSDMLYLLLPFWQRELALSLTEVGVMKTLYSGAMALFQIPSGMAGERLGERWLLAGGTVVAALAVLAFGWAASPFALFALLALSGMGASVQHPLSSVVVAKAHDGAGLRAALSTYNFAGDLGKVAIPGVVALLIARFGWPTATHLAGLFGLLVAAVILTSLRRPLRKATTGEASAAPSAPLAEPARRRAFAALSSIGVVDSATRTGYLTFLPFLLTGKGVTAATLGLMLSLTFAGGALGKFACGVLAARLGVLRTVIATEAATALGIVALLAAPLNVCLALALPIGIALNGTSSVLYGSVAELAPRDRRARAFGFFYTITIGSGALAPTAYGAVSDAMGVPWTMVLVAAVVLLVVPLTLPLRGAFIAGPARS